MRSQKAAIDPVNKTVTLDQEKTIDVAKIIKNEARLKKENQRLQEIIRKQDSTIQALADRNLKRLEEIGLQNKQIQELGKDVHRLAEKQLNLEEKRNSAARLFFKPRIDYFPGTKTATGGGGFLYTFKKWGIGANAGTSGEELYYGGEIAISIF